MIFLLWNGRLPKQDELDALEAQFRANYAIPTEILDLMKTFPKDAEPMDVLRTTVSALAFTTTNQHIKLTSESAVKASVKLDNFRPLLRRERIRQGKDVVSPLPLTKYRYKFSLSNDRRNARSRLKIFDICLILHADHELNASTFATRVASGNTCRRLRSCNRRNCHLQVHIMEQILL